MTEHQDGAPGTCLQCRGALSAEAGFYELARQPGGAAAGQLWRLCSDRCLTRFVIGSED